MLKKTASAIHCGLEFPMSQAWVPANGLLIGLGRKVFIVSTKGENQLKISPLGVLCFLLPEIIKGKLSQGLKAVFYSEMQINAMSFERLPLMISYS